MPCSSISWSSAKLADSPSESASSPGLRREFKARRIRAAHDHGQEIERRIGDAVDLEKGVEAAQFAVMRKGLGAGDVISDRAGLPRRLEHKLGRGEQEPGLGVDKAPDQPRAGDAVNLRALAGDPALRGLAPLRRSGSRPSTQAPMPPSR